MQAPVLLAGARRLLRLQYVYLCQRRKCEDQVGRMNKFNKNFEFRLNAGRPF